MAALYTDCGRGRNCSRGWKNVNKSYISFYENNSGNTPIKNSLLVIRRVLYLQEFLYADCGGKSTVRGAKKMREKWLYKFQIKIN